MHVHRVIDAYTAEQLVYREINVLDDLEYAVSLGVLVTPAIAIDGVLVFSGLPTVSRLRLEVQARLGSSGAN